MRFARRADRTIAANPEGISLSLERGPSADIMRAGDGVHKRYRLLAGPSLNLFHMVAPKLDEKSFKAAKVIIANSEMVRKEISQYYPTCASKVRVVRNGIDTQRFSPGSVSNETKKQLRHRLKLPEHGLRFLFMGNGWKRKGFKQALEIARLCGAVLVIVGKGKGKLPKEVIYKGVVDNMPDYYRASDAFILPTLYDPFSSSVLEALACGLRVVTTRQNGAAEVVKHGETGFILGGQNKDLKEAAAWLAKEPSLSPAQIAKTVEGCTVEKEIAALREIFKEVEKGKQ
jgi:UDP-glucose:(heptosyl)LPS alpha-1,3-glucosyltransferase